MLKLLPYLAFASLAAADPSKFTIRVSSADYHEYLRRRESPEYVSIAEGAEVAGYYGTSFIESKYSGQFRLPRIDVPIGALASVTIKANYGMSLAAAGQDGYGLAYAIAFTSPDIAFSGASSNVAEAFNYSWRAAGSLFNVGPLALVPSNPSSFESPGQTNQYVTVDCRTEASALGPDNNLNDPGARRYALVLHVYPVLQVTYQLNPGYRFDENSIANPTTEGKVSFSKAGILPSGTAPEGAETFPGEIFGTEVKQDVAWIAPKKLSISVLGLEGFTYTLQRSTGLSGFGPVASRAGAGETVRFDIDDSVTSDPSAFYRVQATPIAP